MIPFIVLFLVTASLFIYLFTSRPPFGSPPSGDRLERIRRSPHYQNGAFRNISLTPSLTEGATVPGVMKDFFFGKSRRSKPSVPLPAVHTDLTALDPKENLLVWFGHSSYYMQVDGKRILVDPVFSGSASPLKFTTRSFAGSDIFSAGDMPFINYLFITHDHWDHLDHDTVVKLRSRVGKVITGLGVGAHLERWGYPPSLLTEMDWNEELVLEDGFSVLTATARHFSGRGFKRNGALWMSFILRTPSRNIYIGGDSGYDSHFSLIGLHYGPFDLAILENGQYNKNWKYIHMMPEESVQAASDLRAKRLLPVHWGKFSLSLHDWDEPIIRLVEESEKRAQPVLHPMIGEVVYLDKEKPQEKWWENLP